MDYDWFRTVKEHVGLLRRSAGRDRKDHSCRYSLFYSFHDFVWLNFYVDISLSSELPLMDEYLIFEGEGHAFYLSGVGQLIEEKFNACFDITRDFLFNHLKFPTSVAELNELCIQVYPNPVTDLLTIHLGDVAQSKPLNVTVMDVVGRVAFAETVSSTEARLDVSQWPSGVYVIRTEQEGVCGVRKFVKR